MPQPADLAAMSEKHYESASYHYRRTDHGTPQKNQQQWQSLRHRANERTHRSGYLSCSVTAFNEAGKLLGAMGKGDQVAISGTASLTEWEQNGETKHGISVLAMQVMTPYQKSKRQKAIQKASEEDFDDSLDSI